MTTATATQFRIHLTGPGDRETEAVAIQAIRDAVLGKRVNIIGLVGGRLQKWRWVRITRVHMAFLAVHFVTMRVDADDSIWVPLAGEPLRNPIISIVNSVVTLISQEESGPARVYIITPIE